MNHRKIRIILLTVITCLALLGLAACGEESSVSVHPDADGWVDGAPASETTTVADAGDAPSEPELHSVTGVIDDAAMGTYYVEIDEGVVAAFTFEGVDLDGLTDTRPGSPITVYYTGTLNGNDTSGITVVKMETPTE